MREGWSVVTGGAGFIGRHLVRQLLALGERVRVLDVNVWPGELGPDVEVIRGSVLDPQAVDAALRGARHLYHLAGNPHLWARDKGEFVRVNADGTRMILERAARAGLQRIVVTSTDAVFASRRARSCGASPGEPDAEPSLADMAGPYCESKLLADRAARAAARKGLPVVLVHPTVPVGPGDVNRTPPTQMLLGFLNGKIPAYLECELNLIAVEDVAAGHILAAERGRVGESYILCNETMRLSRLLELLEEVSGVPMPRLRLPYWIAYGFSAVAEALADHVFGSAPVASLTGVRLARAAQQLDCPKAQRELGLPRTPVRDALCRAAEWLIAEGYATQSAVRPGPRPPCGPMPYPRSLRAGSAGALTAAPEHEPLDRSRVRRAS